VSDNSLDADGGVICNTAEVPRTRVDLPAVPSYITDTAGSACALVNGEVWFRGRKLHTIFGPWVSTT
jgi:hypothetical protein